MTNISEKFEIYGNLAWLPWKQIWSAHQFYFFIQITRSGTCLKTHTETCDTNVSAFMKDLNIPKFQISEKANFGGFQVAMATMLVKDIIIEHVGYGGKTSILHISKVQ